MTRYIMSMELNAPGTILLCSGGLSSIGGWYHGHHGLLSFILAPSMGLVLVLLGSVARKSQMDSVTMVPGVTRVPSTIIVTAAINTTNIPTQETPQRPTFKNKP